MIKIENTQVYGWEAAIRGMRNPKNSWAKSDSGYGDEDADLLLVNPSDIGICYVIGDNDMKLMKTLCKAGSDHSKFMRMITISADITTNQVLWAEMDTYKVGTVRNSCSKMHTIHIKRFEADDFSHEGISEVGGSTKEVFDGVLKELESLRQLYNKTKEYKYWRAIIELLPSGYNLRATVMLNYAVARAQYHARKNHKMFEWRQYCEWIETLPYAKELIVGEDEDK